MDTNAVIAEVRALRCFDNKVQEFTDEFNTKSSRMPLKDPGVQEHLKLIYTDGLPKRVKEMLLRDRDYQTWSLTEVQTEAKRQQNVFVYMQRGRPWMDSGGGGPEQNKEQGED